MSQNLPEDAADIRHNTPYSGPYGELPRETTPLMNQWDHEAVVMAPRDGLHFVQGTMSFGPLGELTPEHTEHWRVLDLRVILAHLDSAAQAIKSELDRRYQ